jgi:hypothetical protein
MAAPDTGDSNHIMDVLFVIDATGSMSDALEAAHDRAASIAAELSRAHAGVDFRFGSVCYRDPVDDPRDEHNVQDFTSDIDQLVAFFSGLFAMGGGDEPEDWVGALTLALNNVSWRGGRKSLIWIADAPAHGQRFCGKVNHEDESPKLPPLVAELARRQIFVQGLDLQGGAAPTFAEIKRIYDAAGGPSCDFERFDIAYKSPPRKRLDVLGRDVDAADSPKDFPSDDDYDSDDETRGLPPRRSRPNVIDDTSYVVSGDRKPGEPEDIETKLQTATADLVSRALARPK